MLSVNSQEGNLKRKLHFDFCHIDSIHSIRYLTDLRNGCHRGIFIKKCYFQLISGFLTLQKTLSYHTGIKITVFDLINNPCLHILCIHYFHIGCQNSHCCHRHKKSQEYSHECLYDLAHFVSSSLLSKSCP